MRICKTSADSYTQMKPEYIAKDIQQTISTIYAMLDCNNQMPHKVLKCVSKTHLKTIAAELDTIRKRLDYVLYNKY
jgi:hypothetical protein